MFNRLWHIGVAIATLLLTPGPAWAVEQITFTGEVTYRERIALPPDADLTVTLVSLDASGAPHAIGATALIRGPGQAPLHFTLNVRSDAITDDEDYGLLAEIRAGGASLFHNSLPVRVDPAAPLPVLIIVGFSPEPPPALPVSEPPPVTGELEVTADIFETIWTARSIGGRPVLDATEISFSIASDFRAGGNGGCNSYFTEAMFDGPALRFGPVAGTRMACESKVMQQEAAYFAALAATGGYDLDGGVLDLLDADGHRLVRLVRQ